MGQGFEGPMQGAQIPNPIFVYIIAYVLSNLPMLYLKFLSNGGLQRVSQLLSIDSFTAYPLEGWGIDCTDSTKL